MAQRGSGVMLHYLGGGSQHDPAEFYGRKIVAAKLTTDRPPSRYIGDSSGHDDLRLTFADGTTIAIWDNGQSCCEARYMRTDDDVQSLVGHELRRIEVKPADDIHDGSGDVHEVCFVEIGTDDGFITISNHNEHNGYYGGFGLTITVEEAPTAPLTF